MDWPEHTPPEFDEPEQSGFDSPEPPEARSGASGVLIGVGMVLALAVLIYLGIAQTVTSVVALIGIPLALLWFFWHVFLRKYWRILRIRHAEQRRALLEAARRGRKT